MCHMYALGMCHAPLQDWCAAGWHVTEKDWHAICKNLSAQNKKKPRGDEDGATDGTEGGAPGAKRPRLYDGDIDFDDI